MRCRLKHEQHYSYYSKHAMYDPSKKFLSIYSIMLKNGKSWHRIAGNFAKVLNLADLVKIAKLKTCQYLPRTNLSNLMLNKLSRYTVYYYTVGTFWQYNRNWCTSYFKAKLTIVIDIEDFIIDIISSEIRSKHITWRGEGKREREREREEREREREREDKNTMTSTCGYQMEGTCASIPYSFPQRQEASC